MSDGGLPMPLGQYGQLQRWTTSSEPWSGGHAKFGGGVVEHLVEGIESFRSDVEASNAKRSHRYQEELVAVGCVPWLTSWPVVEALAPFRTLVMIDKSCDAPAARHLNASGRGTWSALLGTDDYAPVDEDGNPRHYGGYEQPHDDYRPVRVIGWRRSSTPRPLLHTKMLVLGTAMFHEDSEFYGWGRMRPQRAWVGSANWTDMSAKHLEFGTWLDSEGDRPFAPLALEHLISLLLFSEPFGTGTTGPEPNLAPVEYDIDLDYYDD